MANNSTTSTIECNDWYAQAGRAAEIPVYYVIVPTLLSLGLIGHLICLHAFYQQSKKEPAYFYQVALTANETCYLIFFACFCFNMIFYWNPIGTSKWFTDSYGLMWFTGHVVSLIINSGFTTNLLLTISMVADRVFALWKPMRYKNFKHKRIRWIMVSLCIFLGITTSIMEYFYNNDPILLKDENTYRIPANLAFRDTEMAVSLSRFRDALRFIGLTVLIFLNIILTIKYHQHIKKVASMTSNTEAAKKEKKESMLFLLALFQCLFNTISMCSVTAFYIAYSLKPTFNECEGQMWSPIMDSVITLMDTVNFFVVFFISKPFRHLILGHTGLLKSFLSNSTGFL